jgi:hypothetical protein
MAIDYVVSSKCRSIRQAVHCKLNLWDLHFDNFDIKLATPLLSVGLSTTQLSEYVPAKCALTEHLHLHLPLPEYNATKQRSVEYFGY